MFNLGETITTKQIVQNCYKLRPEGHPIIGLFYYGQNPKILTHILALNPPDKHWEIANHDYSMYLREKKRLYHTKKF